MQHPPLTTGRYRLSTDENNNLGLFDIKIRFEQGRNEWRGEILPGSTLSTLQKLADAPSIVVRDHRNPSKIIARLTFSPEFSKIDDAIEITSGTVTVLE